MRVDPRDVDGTDVAVPRRSSVASDGTPRMELIDGVRYRVQRPVSHRHGHLTEIYRTGWGLSEDPLVQVNLTTTFPGRVRAWGLHFRTVDRLFVASGAIRIVCWDARRHSPTRGRANEFFLNERNQGLVVIPPGIYHGWQNVGDTEAVMISMPTQFYDHDDPDRFELPWDSPEARELIAFDW